MVDILVVLVCIALLPLLEFKVAEAHKDLENFFLSLQDCVTRVGSTGCENPRFVEYLHNRLEGQVQIVFAISLVLASLQGQEVLKDMLQNLLEYRKFKCGHMHCVLAGAVSHKGTRQDS